MIYCVEDDAPIRELIVYALRSAGFEAEGFPDAKAFYAALEKNMPELVILDIMLPGEDGVSILKRLRQNPEFKRLPVIMASAKGSEFDKVTGLDSGADDYIVKPFGMMELASRVRAALRRSNIRDAEPGQEKLTLGGIDMDLRKHKVLSDGIPVELTYKEFELLTLLMRSPEQAFTRDLLLEKIWGYDFDGETRTVDVHIRSLRQKLGESGSQIETVRGVGYRIKS